LSLLSNQDSNLHSTTQQSGMLQIQPSFPVDPIIITNILIKVMLSQKHCRGTLYSLESSTIGKARFEHELLQFSVEGNQCCSSSNGNWPTVPRLQGGGDGKCVVP